MTSEPRGVRVLMRPLNTVLEWFEESASVYSKSVCEGKCTGVLHLQENVRFLIFKETGDRPLSFVFLFLRKQGTDRFLAFS